MTTRLEKVSSIEIVAHRAGHRRHGFDLAATSTMLWIAGSVLMASLLIASFGASDAGSSGPAGERGAHGRPLGAASPMPQPAPAPAPAPAVDVP